MYSTLIALSTYFLAGIKNIGSIKSSCIILIICFIVLKILSINNPEYYLSLAYGATFVGMASPDKYKWYIIVLASLIYSLVFLLITPFFDGIGGALGFSAFIAMGIIISTKISVSRARKT